MSVGNLRDSGNKGNNFPYQLAVLKLLDAIAANTTSGPSNDLRVSSFTATVTVPGQYTVGDYITRTDIISVPSGTIVATLWFNETTGMSILPPPIGNLTPVIPPTAVTVNNLPVTLGQKPMAASLSVAIASDQSPVPVTNTFLDVPLSTRNAEVTQLLIKTNTDSLDVFLSSRASEATLALVKAKTDNLNVLLSTRASEATLATLGTEATLATMLTLAGFQARINTLGQKTSAASTPVVIASDQSAIPVNFSTPQTVKIEDTAGNAITSTAGALDVNLKSDIIIAAISIDQTTPGVTNGVVVNSSALPAGAATEGTLATRASEATLALIKAKTDNLDVLLSTRASEATLLTRLSKADFEARINTLGQKLMAASTPVVLASDQSALPVTIAAPLTVKIEDTAGNAITSTAGALDVNLKSDIIIAAVKIDQTVPGTTNGVVVNSSALPTGASTEATQLLVKAKTDNLDVLLSTRSSEATLATRASEATLATMLTLAGFQARINTLGQKTSANSTPVVLASDQSSIPVTLAGSSGVPVFTNVASAVADTVLFAANASRKGATIFNDSTQALYVKFATGASATSYTVQMEGNGYYEVPFGYTGAINGFWATANGNARLTELT